VLCAWELCLLHLRVLRLGLLQDGDVEGLLHRNGSHLLRREADAAQEVIEAWVGAQGVPGGFHLKKIEPS